MLRLQFWRRRGAWSHMWVCCVRSGLWWMGRTGADLCSESITANGMVQKRPSRWHWETPTCWLSGDVCLESTHSWRQTDPLLMCCATSQGNIWTQDLSSKTPHQLGRNTFHSLTLSVHLSTKLVSPGKTTYFLSILRCYSLILWAQIE